MVERSSKLVGNTRWPPSGGVVSTIKPTANSHMSAIG